LSLFFCEKQKTQGHDKIMENEDREVTETMKSRCILAAIDFGADTEKIVSYAAYFSAGT